MIHLLRLDTTRAGQNWGQLARKRRGLVLGESLIVTLTGRNYYDPLLQRKKQPREAPQLRTELSQAPEPAG